MKTRDVEIEAMRHIERDDAAQSAEEHVTMDSYVPRTPKVNTVFPNVPAFEPVRVPPSYNVDGNAFLAELAGTRGTLDAESFNLRGIRTVDFTVMPGDVIDDADKVYGIKPNQSVSGEIDLGAYYVFDRMAEIDIMRLNLSRLRARRRVNVILALMLCGAVALLIVEIFRIIKLLT